MKLFTLFISLTISSLSFAQTQDSIKNITEYYPGGELKIKGKRTKRLFVDTLYSYDTKGRLTSQTIYGPAAVPRTIKSIQYYKGKPKIRIKGTYIQLDTTNIKKDGTWLYYRKNGSVMDSLIFENGKQIYRARLKNGEILFEE